jgi:Carboxypeptidase regulatory-like domain
LCKSFLVAATRIVAALILLSATVVAVVAQPPAQIPFSVKVADQAGGLIPSAIIQIISSSSQTKFESKTNLRGEAVLSLDPGTYTVAVRAPGFKTWRSSFDLQRDSSRSITAVMLVASNGSPIVNPDYLEPEVQPLVATIPLESLESLTFLPARDLEKPAHTHHQIH